MKLKSILSFAMATMISASILVVPAAASAPAPQVPNPNFIGNVKLTYWASIGSNGIAGGIKNMNDIPLFKEMEKATGVKIEFLHPNGDASGAANIALMIAAADLPDIIETTNLSGFPGGIAPAVEEGTIVGLNALIDQYAPNYKKILADMPEVDKYVKTDDGVIYTFPYISAGVPISGMYLRKDWLDDLNLKLPETVSDWENVLNRFKNRKGAKTPLASRADDTVAFAWAYGVHNNFFLENGKAVYGPGDVRYKEYLDLMKRWYGMGFFDNADFFTANASAYQAKIDSYSAGAFYNTIGGGLGSAYDRNESKDPKFAMSPTQYPVLKKGDIPQLGALRERCTNVGALITGACKNQEAAVRWFDYLFSEEGTKLKNYGIEGEHYTDINGYPKFNDIIMKNPDKLPVTGALGKYTYISYGSVGVEEMTYQLQYWWRQSQRDAASLFNKYNDNFLKSSYPSGVSYTVAEQKTINEIQAPITTYVNEMRRKFITGEESLDNYDKYLDQLNKMGIKRITEIRQDAYGRYLAR